MPNTIHYYGNANNFFNNTVELDTSSLYNEFLPLLPEKAHILDAGCGSGRDTKAFIAHGYKVTAFDASATLAQLASKHTGTTIQQTTFLNFTSPHPFDAIWACASLLDAPYESLNKTFHYLTQHLKPGGYFYCSFKTSDSKTALSCNRHFTHLTLDELTTSIEDTELTVHKHWHTQDIREDRQHTQWLNAILKKDA